MIRIYQDGWNQFDAARTPNEVRAAVRIDRIEIDVSDDAYITIPADRITGVTVEASGTAFQSTEVSLLGAVEFHYLDRDGNDIVSEGWIHEDERRGVR